MKVQVFHLFFKNDFNGGLTPIDGELHALAVKYAKDNMTTDVEFSDYKESWVACEVDAEGKPVRALGILCMVFRADFAVCRFTDNAAVVKLVQRANDFLHDQGLRGQEALVYMSANELPENRCPDYLEWMKVFDLKPADRYTITVK